MWNPIGTPNEEQVLGVPQNHEKQRFSSFHLQKTGFLGTKNMVFDG